MRTPNLLLVFTFALTTSLLPTSIAQVAQQDSDGQIQVPTSLPPITTPPAPKLAGPTTSPLPPPLVPAPIESATTVAPPPPPSTTAVPPPSPPTTVATKSTASVPPPAPPPPNEAASTLPPPPPLIIPNINVTFTSTSSCTGTSTGTGTGSGTAPSLVGGNTTVPIAPSAPSVAAPAPTEGEGGPSEAGTMAPTAASNMGVGRRLGWGGVGGGVVVLVWSL